MTVEVEILQGILGRDHVQVCNPWQPGMMPTNQHVRLYFLPTFPITMSFATREILLARIRNPIFVQARLKGKVPGNIKIEQK